MLAARNVTVMRGPRVVLDGVDLSVDAGSRIGVLGRNGAGKSTLLRVAAGLLPATGGSVWFGEERIDDLRVRTTHLEAVIHAGKPLAGVQIVFEIRVSADRRLTAQRRAP